MTSERLHITVWVKWTGTGPDQRIWSMGDGANKYMYLTPMDGTTGKLRFVISDGTTTQYLDGVAPMPANTWTHVAVTFGSPVFNTTTRTWSATGTLYVNGAQVATLAGMLVPDSLNAPLMENANYLGRGNAGNYFQGYIDDFRVYMKTLTRIGYHQPLQHGGPGPDHHHSGYDGSDAQCRDVACQSHCHQRQCHHHERDCRHGRTAVGWNTTSPAHPAAAMTPAGCHSTSTPTSGLPPALHTPTPSRCGTRTVIRLPRQLPLSATTQASSMSGVTASFAYGPIGIYGTSTSNGQIKMTATKLTSPSGLVGVQVRPCTSGGALSNGGHLAVQPELHRHRP